MAARYDTIGRTYAGHRAPDPRIAAQINAQLAGASRVLNIGAGPGSLGPVNLPIPCVVDRSVALMSDFAAGANQDGKHYFNINWERDVALPEVADLRNVVEGDPSPDGKGTLTIKRGIEVGHIFQLGTKYSEALNATVLDDNGRSVVMPMGCYGIGVSRVVAAAIEQNNDAKGILWPASIAPFEIAIVPMNMQKSERVREAAEALYKKLCELGSSCPYQVCKCNVVDC